MNETAKVVAPTESARPMNPHQHITYVLFMGQPHHYPTHTAASEDADRIKLLAGQKPRLIRSLNVSKHDIPKYEATHEAFLLLDRCRRFAEQQGAKDLAGEIAILLGRVSEGPSKRHGDLES